METNFGRLRRKKENFSLSLKTGPGVSEGTRTEGETEGDTGGRENE